MNFRSGLVHTTITDHYPIFVSISQNVPLPNNPIVIKYRNIDSVSLRKFKFALNASLIDSIYVVNDPKQLLNYF